jgi:hypothetical protein
MLVNAEQMEENCIRTELSEYSEDHQEVEIQGLTLVVLGDISISGIDHYVVNVKPVIVDEDVQFILTLVKQ